MTELSATIYSLFESSPSRSPLSIWKEVIASLEEEFDEKYRTIPGRKYQLLISDSKCQSPSGKYLRFRIIKAHIRLKPGAPALLDLSIGNVIYNSDNIYNPIATADVSETNWVRSVTRVSVQEHLKAVNEFLDDIADSGWHCEEALLKNIPCVKPLIENGYGVIAYDPSHVSRIISRPKFIPDRQNVAVYYIDATQSRARVGNRILSSWKSLFKGVVPEIFDNVDSPLSISNSVTLIVIPDNLDLVSSPFLEKLRSWEKAGFKFKLSKYSTVFKQYPMANICFDLALLSGMIPWRPKTSSRNAVSMDAGHDPSSSKSRWAKACVNANLEIESIQIKDTVLAEHIPTSLINDYWPGSHVEVIYRDGRLASERNEIEMRAFREGKDVFEVKKNPTAILYRGDPEAATGAKYADCIVDPHGEVLLQTLNQGSGDAIFPLRISINSKKSHLDAINTILTHSASPSLSIFQQPRLPGVMYFADMASKLDQNGWSQVIGRGFMLQDTIPSR